MFFNGLFQLPPERARTVSRSSSCFGISAISPRRHSPRSPRDVYSLSGGTKHIARVLCCRASTLSHRDPSPPSPAYSLTTPALRYIPFFPLAPSIRSSALWRVPFSLKGERGTLRVSPLPRSPRSSLREARLLVSPFLSLFFSARTIALVAH